MTFRDDSESCIACHETFQHIFAVQEVGYDRLYDANGIRDELVVTVSTVNRLPCGREDEKVLELATPPD